MKKYRYSFLAGVLVGIATLLYVKVAIESLAFGPVGDERKFDRKVWIESKGELERFEMTEDLQIYYLRKGIPKSKVLELLGTPDASGHYQFEYSDTTRMISYEIGFVFLDPCTFDLTFSKDEKLISYETNCN